ncbi:MAG TPA: PD-(D/E)XK nuclease family protein [Gammaproteobacteria bacterium]|nr:PD-(D/E)XK nuclease family protein [Gammaproteobacteria bacterium]
MGLATLFDELAAGATVVTVNDRLARRLRDRWAHRCRGAGYDVWETPPIMSFGGWLMSLYAARRDATLGGAPTVEAMLLAPSQVEAVWTKLIRQSRHGHGGDLLQPTATAEAAMDAWRLCQAWRVPLARLAAGSDDSTAFVEWARAYEDLCKRERWLDAAMLADWLRGELGRLSLPQRLIFAGFDEWTPQQTALLDAIGAGGVVVIRDGLPAASFADLRAVAAADADAELREAALWAADYLKAGGAGRIGIVVPDLRARREAAIRAVTAAIDPGSLAPAAGGQALPVNVSVGTALADTPLVCDALLALGCGGSAFDLEDIGRLLRSPFIGGAGTERLDRAQLDIQLRRHGEARITGTTLRYFAERTGCSLWVRYWAAFNQVFADAPRAAGARVWAETIDYALSALGWPGERALDSTEYQTLEAFRELLTDFARLELVLDASMRGGEALSRLRRLAAQRQFQPRRAEAPVQVLGMLEAAALDFDRLWVTGLDDRNWPARAEPNPFIPAGVQREYGLPHSSAERELAFAEAITRRLFGAAPEVVVSWPARDGDVELRPSPLVPGHLGGAAGHEAAPQVRTDESWRDQIYHASRLETFVDDRAPPLAAGASIRGGAGLLKDQAACPFRAFASRRLRAEMPALPSPGLDAAVRGQLVHSMLDAFWQSVGDQATLARMGEAARATAINSAIEAALERASLQHSVTLSPRLRDLEKARLNALLAQWLEKELLRAPFQVVAREFKATLSLASLVLQLRIDRIDRLNDGGEAVVDYKTGAIGGDVWGGERPDEPQLPAYALSRDGNVTAVLFGSLHRDDKFGWRGIASDLTGIQPLYRGADDVDPRTLQREWRVVLQDLAAAFRDGDARVDPKDIRNTCKYCGLQALCRIAEQAHG